MRSESANDPPPPSALGRLAVALTIACKNTRKCGWCFRGFIDFENLRQPFKTVRLYVFGIIKPIFNLSPITINVRSMI